MKFDNARKELWWVRTSCARLKVVHLCRDSEGSKYFIDIDDFERTYETNDVILVGRVTRPTNGALMTKTLDSPKGRVGQLACGARALSFKGWTTFRCGKCPTCRIRGNVSRIRTSRIVRT